MKKLKDRQALNQSETIAADIVKFAQDNNLKIHPGQEPLKWADLVIEKEGCPCVPGRDHCPCEFVLDDIKELGRCRCGLFCNDAYIELYNELQGGKSKREGNPRASGREVKEKVAPKAKGKFLKKISINGFAIEERDDYLILRPRGMEATAEITIQEVEPNVWRVVGASGQYAGFYRGKKRSYFEAYINRWAAEAVLQAAG